MKSLPSLYQYGSGCQKPDGLRIGVSVDHRLIQNQGEEHSESGNWDVAMPMLAPSPELETAFRKGEMDWEHFSCRYRQEIDTPECRQVIQLIAALADRIPIALGCYCAEDAHCHRSLLRELIREAEGNAVHAPVDPRTLAPQVGYSSPACFANWDDLE